MRSDISRMVDDYERGRLSRRQLIAHLTGLAAVMAAAPRARGAGAGDASTFRGTDLNHIALRVTDIDRSRAFYEKHLGLTVASQGGGSCFLRCRENNFVALFRGEKPGLDHYCYSIEDYDPDAAVAKLKGAGLEPRRRGDRVYFDDPDGLEVQVASKTHNV